LYPKGEENILLNGLHNPFLDTFFYSATFIGDGLFCVFMVILFLFFSYKKAIWLGLSFLSSAIITQILKSVFNAPRPKLFLPDFNLLHQVADVTIHTSRSFPSGHATSAFTLGFCLAYFAKKNSAGFFFCLIGVIAAASRIYLLQHFLIDVVVGSIIGVIISLLVCTSLDKSSLVKKSWINKSLISNKQ
jgi:membrane-associated phospholipid phosphatase